MAIESFFYTGPTNGQQWAIAQGGIGEKYWVRNADAAKVTVVGSAARTVRVAPDWIAGHGVVDHITEAENIELDDPSPGQVIHYTIVARRVWGPSGGTSLIALAGAATKAIAASRETDPGLTTDDQPLAIVAVTGGQPTPVVVADLRAIGSGGRYEAFDILTLTYMNEPGYVVRIGTTEWLRLADGTWRKYDTPDVVANSTIVETNHSGHASVPYGATFIAPPIFVPTIGDDASGPGLAGAVATVRDPDSNSRSTTRCVVQVRNASGSPVANVTVRIDWIAVGRLA